MKRARSQEAVEPEHGAGVEDSLGTVVLPAPVGTLEHGGGGGTGAGAGAAAGGGGGPAVTEVSEVAEGGGEGAAVEAAPADFQPAVGVEVFGEAETRALIRLRHEMNPQFQMHLRKRGIRDCYSTLTQRLHEEGQGQVWPC
jgi:hypothetical protein